MASEIVELIIRAKDLASLALSGVEKATRKLSDVTQTYHKTLNSLNSTADAFRANMQRLAAVIGAAGVARSFIEINASAEKTKLMLGGIMGSAEKATEAFEWLLEVSTKAPFSIGAMKDAFVKLQVAGLDPMRGSLETLMDAISAFGGADQDLQMAAVAIQQMAGKGVISMEELRQQLGERVPTAMKAMAEGLGMNMQEMVNAIESGNLSTEKGLNAMMGKLKEWYGGTGVDMMNSWTGLISNLKVAWEKFMLVLGESGIFDKLKSTLDGLLKKIEEMKASGELQEWGDRIAKTASSLIDMFIRLAGVFGMAFNALGPFLPVIIEMIVYFKAFKIVFGGLIGLPLSLVREFIALKEAFITLGGTRILSFLSTLRTALLASAEASTLMSVALKATVIGAIIFAVYEIGNLIYKIIQYKKEVKELAEVEAWSAEQREYSAERAEKYNKILQELGFKTMKEFNAAVKEGTVAYNEQTKAWEKVTKAANEQQKTYETLILSLQEGSAQWIAVKDKELKTLKEQTDYEIALLEQQYKDGKIELEQYLEEKKRLQENYLNEVIILKEKEIELLKKAPEENLDKIKSIEEEIKQVKIQSAQEQIKIQEDFTNNLKGGYQKDYDNWKSLQELKLQSLESQFDLQNTIEETMVQRGIIRQSELLENQMSRLREFYEEKIRMAEETMTKIASLEGADTEEYRKALADRERLQKELEVKIIASEQQISDAREKEELEALQFIAEITGDRISLAGKEIEDRIKELNKFYTQGLIEANQYYEALEILEREYTSEFKLQLQERTEQLNLAIDIINERRTSLQDSVKLLMTEGWEDVKNWFGGWEEAISTTVKDVQYQIDQFMNNTTMKGYETFWNASIFGRRLIEMVGTSVYEWSQRVADYINYIKSLMQSLQGYINSLRMQLMQLRGDRLGELEMWYAEEKKKLEEKYADELGKTAEYYEALSLLDELYKEKKKKILEEMKDMEEDYAEEKNRPSRGGIFGGGIADITKNLIPDFVGSLIPALPGGLTEVKVSKDIKLDSVFEIKTYDVETTDRYIRDVFFPRFERYLKLKGIEL